MIELGALDTIHLLVFFGIYDNMIQGKRLINRYLLRIYPVFLVDYLD